MHRRYFAIVFSLACGAAPAVSAPVLSAARVEPPAEIAPEAPEAPDPNRIYGFNAGETHTCLLRGSRLRCFGAIERDVEVDADLLHVGAEFDCIARSGRSAITCRGALTPLYDPHGLEENWRMECDGDQDCVDDEWDAWSERAEAEGLRLPTPRPIVGLAGDEGSVCALDTADGITCFDLFAEDPTAEVVTFTVSGATALAMGAAGGCARIADGTVQCWNRDEDEAGPRRIEGVSGAVRVAVTPSFACAWDGDDRARCWGWGMPFDRDDLEENVARAVPALDGARDLGASANGIDEFACVVLRDGGVRCAGKNLYGQLGRAPSENDDEEGLITVAVRGVVRVAVGDSHACSMSEAGAIYCWGRADGGALGAEHARSDWSPVEVSGVLADRVIAYGTRTCARTVEGWSCWGRDDYSDRRALPWEPRRSLAPREAEPLHMFGSECALVRGTLRCPDREDVAVRAIAGECIITSDRRVACARSESFEDLDARRDAIAIASSGSGSRLAVLTPGELRAIERNYGQPPEVRATFAVGAAPIRELAMAYSRVCFRRADRSVHCGETSGGELHRVEIPPSEQIVSDGSGMCSRSARGVVHCWRGGEPAPTSSETPVLVPDLEAVELAGGAGHVCARTRSRAVVCWGTDDHGQLGMRPAWWTDGPVSVSLEPVQNERENDR